MNDINQEIEQELIDSDDYASILREYSGEDRVVSTKELWNEIQEERKKNPSQKFSSPFKTLNEMTKGFQAGNLVIVSGPSGMGKTTLAQTFTEHLIQHNPLWFSYELPADEFLERFPNIPVFYMPRRIVTKNLDWIETRIKESIVKNNTQVIFIDHLSYLIDTTKGNNDMQSARIEEIMRTLKTLCNNTKIIIFLMVHMKHNMLEVAPSLQDLKGSSSIGQESDLVLFLWRKRKKQGKELTREEGILYEDESTLSVQKNRRTGVLGSIPLIFEAGKYYEKEFIPTDEQNA